MLSQSCKQILSFIYSILSYSHVGWDGLEADASRFRWRKDHSQPNNSTCKLCHSEPEDPFHFISKCPALSPVRSRLLSSLVSRPHFSRPAGKMGLVNCLFHFRSSAPECWRIVHNAWRHRYCCWFLEFFCFYFYHFRFQLFPFFILPGLLLSHEFTWPHSKA